MDLIVFVLIVFVILSFAVSARKRQSVVKTLKDAWNKLTEV